MNQIKEQYYYKRTSKEKNRMRKCKHLTRTLAIIIMNNTKHMSLQCTDCNSNKFIQWDYALYGARSMNVSVFQKKTITIKKNTLSDDFRFKNEQKSD